MSDENRRELERKVANGDKEAQQALLAVRARAGEIEIADINGTIYEVRPWSGRTRDAWGNGGAPCTCPKLKRVIGMFCVCMGRAWCPEHGGPRCVGGHD